MLRLSVCSEVAMSHGQVRLKTDNFGYYGGVTISTLLDPEGVWLSKPQAIDAAKALLKIYDADALCGCAVETRNPPIVITKKDD